MLGSARWGVGAVAAAAVIAFSCTVFNDLNVGGGPDASMPGDANMGDAQGDGGPTQMVFLSIEDAARLCTLSLQCTNLAESITVSTGVPVDTLNYSACIDWLAGPIPSSRIGFGLQQSALKCAAQQTSCATAGACLSYEHFEPDDTRCNFDAGTGIQEKCDDDGGTVLKCEANVGLHCLSSYYGPGSRCIVGGDGVFWCATGTGCNQSVRCSGALLVYCAAGDSGVTESINCSSVGYGCGTDPDSGVTECLSGTFEKLCSTTGDTKCIDGDDGAKSTVVQVCDSFHYSQFDCEALGGTCTKQGGGAARCMRAGDACTPYDPTVNVCNGTSLSLCVGGRPSSVDCAKIGKQCAPSAGAQSGRCK